jgi:hypothetical protein
MGSALLSTPIIAPTNLAATRFFATSVTSQFVRDYAFSQTELRKSGPCGAV